MQLLFTTRFELQVTFVTKLVIIPNNKSNVTDEFFFHHIWPLYNVYMSALVTKITSDNQYW